VNRRASGRHVWLAPGYVLHQHAYRDTSRIVEVFTAEHGRLTLFARGARAPLDDIVALAVSDAEALGRKVPALPQPGKLTDREWEIASLAGDGLSPEQIARQLFISGPTVAEHLRCVFSKLGVSSADQLKPWLADADQR